MHQVAVSLHVSSFRTGHHDKTPTTSILLSAQNLVRVSCPSPPPEGNGQGARRCGLPDILEKRRMVGVSFVVGLGCINAVFDRHAYLDFAGR